VITMGASFNAISRTRRAKDTRVRSSTKRAATVRASMIRRFHRYRARHAARLSAAGARTIAPSEPRGDGIGQSSAGDMICTPCSLNTSWTFALSALSTAGAEAGCAGARAASTGRRSLTTRSAGHPVVARARARASVPPPRAAWRGPGAMERCTRW
jgi:hypothetical protein